MSNCFLLARVHRAPSTSAAYIRSFLLSQLGCGMVITSTITPIRSEMHAGCELIQTRSPTFASDRIGAID